jgi:3-deoxy-D-manno-octulosonate 8-phosphate phosphatase (KDO 8-P phosphatase)
MIFLQHRLFNMSNAFSPMVTNPYTEHPQALDRAAKVKLLVLDVDGVLTDGSLLVGQDGKEALKIFDSLDGHGIKLLQSTGVVVAIITGRNSLMVEGRAKELGIKHVQMGVSEKFKALQILLEQTKLTLSDCAAMGDDWPDLSVLPKVHFAACPAQAHEEVKKRVHFIAKRSGGAGAVREVCDLILVAQDNYQRLLQESL